MNKLIILSIVVILLIYSCDFSEKNLTGKDIALFKGKAWELAKAVQKEDTTKITKIINDGEIQVDYQETKFGETLLMWAARTGHYLSVKTLLENGADPNLQNNYNGKSALMYASNFGPDYDRDPRILKLMLQYGGDPNAEQGFISEENNSIETPLIIAAGCCFEKVELLVEAGADINYRTKFGGNALYEALSGANEKAEIVHYLIIEKGADFCKPVMTTLEGEDITVLDKLKQWNYPTGTEEYEKQMEVINYIHEHSKKCSDTRR